MILLYRFLCARKQCVYSGCSQGIKLLQQCSRGGTQSCHLNSEKNQPGRQWKNSKENSSVSVANERGVEFHNQSVLWVSAEGGMGKVLLNGAVSFKSSPVSAQRECYFRFPTIPWLGAFSIGLCAVNYAATPDTLLFITSCPQGTATSTAGPCHCHIEWWLNGTDQSYLWRAEVPR
jgi:hypothetical protein